MINIEEADLAARLEYSRGYNIGWEAAKVSTIERCAQVVHNLQQRLSDRAESDAGFVFAFNDAIREAVAAIRALKDEP